MLARLRRILPVLFSTFDTVFDGDAVSRATSVMATRFATAPLLSHHRACSARVRRNARLIQQVVPSPAGPSLPARPGSKGRAIAPFSGTDRVAHRVT